MTTTLDQALQQLVDEGDVRISLYVRGITGWRGRPGACPVARYLQVETLEHVTVGTLTVFGEDGKDAAHLPHVIGKFVCDFDYGEFPELDEGKRWTV